MQLTSIRRGVWGLRALGLLKLSRALFSCCAGPIPVFSRARRRARRRAGGGFYKGHGSVEAVGDRGSAWKTGLLWALVGPTAGAPRASSPLSNERPPRLHLLTHLPSMPSMPIYAVHGYQHLWRGVEPQQFPFIASRNHQSTCMYPWVQSRKSAILPRWPLQHLIDSAVNCVITLKGERCEQRNSVLPNVNMVQFLSLPPSSAELYRYH